MIIDTLLKDLGTHMGLSDLELNEERVCRLVFDRKYIVDMELADNEKTLNLYSVIAPLPEKNREELFATLLDAHFFGIKTGGAVFTVDLDGDEILLFKTIDLDPLNVNIFASLLENFVHQVENWTQRLVHQGTTPNDFPDAPATGPGDEILLKG